MAYYGFMSIRNSNIRRFPPKTRGRLALLLGLLVLVVTTGCEKETPSVIEPIIAKPEYSFFVAGHTYGAPGVDNIGLHPPFVSCLKGRDIQQFSFGVLTGDIVRNPSVEDWDEVDAELLDFPCPVYFSVGNHDMYDRELFTSRYGSTWYAFHHEGDLFIVLDAEEEPGNLTVEQISFLAAELGGYDYERAFLFVHKLVWVGHDTPYFSLHGLLNSVEGYDFFNNFWPDIVPLLQYSGVPVYVFAGDVGVSWAMPLFWQEVGNITLIASGMGGSEEENYLEVSISQGSVEVLAVRLDGGPLELGHIEAYNLEHYSLAQKETSATNQLKAKWYHESP